MNYRLPYFTEYLIGDKNKKEKGKVSHIKFKSHHTQEYLKSKDASIHLKKFIFLLRSRMLDLAANFPNKILSVVPRWKKSGYPGAPDALSTSSRWKPIVKEIAGL